MKIIEKYKFKFFYSFYININCLVFINAFFCFFKLVNKIYFFYILYTFYYNIVKL